MQLFACPVCMCPLKKEEKRYLCPHGHSFDLAKEGYVHLLPANRMHAKLPGDGKEMLAAPRHLFQLKEAVYAQPYENETKDTAYAGFTFLKRVPVRGEITLKNGNAVRDLFTMTPYHWKTSVEDREKLEALTGLTTEIGFDFVCYRRQEG